LVKANLFLGAGAAKRLAGSEEFGRAGGIWRVRPWFSLLFLIPALSLAGVPPFSGFWAKLLLARATIEIGSAGLTFMVLGVGFLTLFAMARIWAAVFWSAHPEGDGAITERLPAAMLVPLLALTGAIVYIGIDAGPMVEGAAAIATGLIDPQAYVAAVLGGAE
ncbi:MAG: Na+/H+ antiporter subunit D, partial [Rhodobacteraceae bacterium]|nr:Na+/H+ antiporter subunit D [Paracoccaceae bacterium]